MTNINTQKIDGNKLKIYKIVIVLFLIDNKDEKFRFFKKTFLLVNSNLDIVFEIDFFILGNVEININN